MVDGKYEFCVMHYDFPEDPHRTDLTEQGCYDWVREAELDGIRPGAFYVAHRKVGPWVKS